MKRLFIIILFTFVPCASAQYAPPSIVQSKPFYFGQVPAANFVLPNPTTQGDSYLVCFFYNSATISVTDTQSDTFSLTPTGPGFVTFPFASNNFNLFTCYFANNIAGGASTTITVNLSPSSFIGGWAIEISGQASVSPIDKTAAALGNSGSASSGALTTSAADLVLGFFDAAGNNSFTPTGGFVGFGTVNSINALGAQLTQSAAGSIAATATLSSSAWTAGMVAITGSSASLVSIAVTPSVSTIVANNTQQMTAVGTYSDSSTRGLTASATWSSSNAGVATVAPGGLVTAIIPGTTTIVVNSGLISGTATLNVTPQIYDLYGGLLAANCPLSVAGRFDVYQDTRKHWWWCTPLNHPMFGIAVFTADYGGGPSDQGKTQTTILNTKYGSQAIWATKQTTRLKGFGWNQITDHANSQLQAWSPSPPPDRMPATEWADDTSYPVRNVFNYCSQPASDIGQALASFYTAQRAPNVDPFDPCFPVFTHGTFTDTVRNGPWLTSPWLLVWSSGESDTTHGMGAMSTAPDPDGGGGFQTIPPGHNDYHIAAAVLFNATTQVFNQSQNTFRTLDRTFYGKLELANWLQGLTEATASVTCSRAASIVTCIPGANHPYIANDILTLISCSDSTFNTVPGTGVTTTSVTATTVVFTLAGTGSSATGCTISTGPGYNSITGLNTSWGTGAGYGSFGTSGVSQTANIGTGNGSQVLFSGTLSPCPDKDSIWVKDGSTVRATDNMSGSLRDAIGNASPAFSVIGSVNYTPSCNISVTFPVAPINGNAITVSYISGGWGSGSGLLDEDGRHPWCPTDQSTLAGANAAMKTDLDNFLFHFSKALFKTQKAEVNLYNTTNSTHILYGGPNVIGSWDTPPRRQVLQAASPYIDVLMTNIMGLEPDAQARLDYTMKYLGNHPLGSWTGFPGNADSQMFRYSPAPVTFEVDNQAQRASQYASVMNWYLNATVSSAVPALQGVKPFIQLREWGLYDQYNEGFNWGLFSFNDNPYDGVHDCVGSSTELISGTTYTDGGEEQIPAWAATTAYVLPAPNSSPAQPGVKDTVQINISGTIYQYVVSTAGTSGSSTVAACTAYNCTWTNGTVVWRNVGVKASATCYGNFLGTASTQNALWPSFILPGVVSINGSGTITGSGVVKNP